MQRLTYNTSVNTMVGLYIDKNDKLFLLYRQWWWDPQNQPYRDTLFLMTKEKGGEWSQPQRISIPAFEVITCWKYVGYDPYSDLIHLFYDCDNETLYYTNSNIPDWETVKTDSGPELVRPKAVAFDTMGNTHLAWVVNFDSIGSNWCRMMYANNSTGQWVKQQVSAPIWLGGMRRYGSPSFDVQKNGTAHLVYNGEPYCDTECMAFYVRNDSLNSTSWVLDTVPQPSRTLWSYGVGPIKVDVNNRVHLITSGCTIEYCEAEAPEELRTFYYYKQAEDSIWQGPELIPDSLFTVFSTRLFIDKVGIPCLIERDPSTYHLFFTSRKQGAWEQPYEFFDDTLYYTNFRFVIDSEGRGHGAFETYNFSGNPDEIFYFGPPSTSVQDPTDPQTIYGFQLFQNYPNPFNSVTRIQYTLSSPKDPSDRQSQPVQTTLKIYNILGKEVRELVNTSQKPGLYKVYWDGKDNRGDFVSSGIYFFKLKRGGIERTKKMVMIK